MLVGAGADRVIGFPLGATTAGSLIEESGLGTALKLTLLVASQGEEEMSPRGLTGKSAIGENNGGSKERGENMDHVEV
jgi:hypothetical protein